MNWLATLVNLADGGHRVHAGEGIAPIAEAVVWATLALSEGVHPKVVAERLGQGQHPKVVADRLGHSGIQITLDLYSHVTEGLDRKAAAVANLIDGAGR